MSTRERRADYQEHLANHELSIFQGDPLRRTLARPRGICRVPQQTAGVRFADELFDGIVFPLGFSFLYNFQNANRTQQNSSEHHGSGNLLTSS